MATLDEVVAEMLGDDYIHDPIQFVIDSDLRVISIPRNGVIAGVVGDKNVNRVNFQMPRYYNGFDMSKFTTRVNYVNALGNFNYYSVTDLTIEDDLIYFTWLVDSDVVAYAGIVMFAVNMFIADSNGKIIQSFNTSNKGLLNVLEGLQVNEYVTPEEQEDILTRLEADISKYVDSGIAKIDEKTNESIRKIQTEKNGITESITSGINKISSLTTESIGEIHNEGINVKNSIPADYTELDKTVSDITVQIPGWNEAKEKVVSLKTDIGNYYPKKQGAFKCVNMVSNLPNEVIMPSGIEKNILDGVCAINGTSTIDYPNFIIKKSVLANHVYLFSVKMKENENTFQSCSLITRIGTKSITRNTLGEYPVQLFENENYPEYTTFCALFSHDSNTNADFSISFSLTKTGKKVAISAKDIIIADVTGLSDTQITEIVKNGMKDGVYYNPGKNVADALSNQVKEDITVETIKRMYPNPNGYWYGKKCLVIGDSTSATEQWQKKLYENLGMSVTTHAKGGIGFLQMVVGSLGYEGNYDNETGNTGVLQPLKASDVYDKDLIIIFGGFNNRGTKLGEITDLYKTDGTGQNTVTGQLQFVLNWIYDLLKGNESYAQNLKCKIVLVTPYCCGKYNYVNYDGYSGDSWTGYTLREMCDRIVEIASLNNCSSYNAWENSGIGRHTWTIYSASPTATKEAGSDTAPYPTNADQLHLNNSVGYPHLGDCISAFVSGIV